MYLRQIGKLTKARRISKRNIDDTMMGERTHSSQRRTLLSTTLCASRDEDTSVFTPVAASSPLAAGGVPESLPLCREVAVAGGDAEEEGVVGLEGLGVDDWVFGFGWCVHLDGCVSCDGSEGAGGEGHLGQDFFWEGLCDLVDVGCDANLGETSLLGLSD